MGSTFTSAASQVSSANQNLLSSEQDVIQSTVEFGTDIATELTNSTFEILSSLSAGTGIIELAEMQSIKQRESLTDSTIQSLQTAQKEILVSHSVNDNNRDFGSMSLSGTGDLFVNLAASLKTGIAHSEDIARGKSNRFAEYLNYAKGTDSAILNSKKAAKTFGEDDVKAIFLGSQDDAASKITEEILTYLVSPSPNVLDKNASSKEKVKLKTDNAQALFLANILFSWQSMRYQTINNGWESHYFKGSTDSSKMSLFEYLEGAVEGRTESEGWYNNMLFSTSNGLLREKAYLGAEENALLFLIAKIRDHRNQLMALSLAKDLAGATNSLAGLAK